MSLAKITWPALAITLCLLVLQPAMAADAGRGRLVSVDWLAKKLEGGDVLVIDASPGQVHAARHIPGAVSVDPLSFGGRELPLAEMERRIQSWGIGGGRQVVIYDQGGSYLATSLFFDLHYHGVPAADLFVLDGGLAKWQASGRAVTNEPTPAPPRGSFRVEQLNEDLRVRLPEFLVASGDPVNHALVEALDASYHYGAAKFFDRAGHVPHAISLPSEDFFNADKTFKSADEARRMLAYLGVRPEQQIHTYCGGGIAASLPFFAMKFMLGFPRVKLYKGSQLEWLRDDRELPLWTYAAPYRLRDRQWLAGWSSPMTRMFGVARLAVVDVRTPEAYGQGHVPFALNIPADTFKAHLGNPAGLAGVLGAAGVNAGDEAVIMSEGGLNPRAALAFVMLEKLGQQRVSVLLDSVDDWGLGGHTLTREPTVVGARKSPRDLAVPATPYAASPRPGVLVTEAPPSPAAYPKVYIASGRAVPANLQDGKVVHIPYTEFLQADGRPKPAKDLWSVLTKAGLPRYAEIVCVSDDPGEAAVSYFILKLMGYPDVKLRLS